MSCPGFGGDPLKARMSTDAVKGLNAPLTGTSNKERKQESLQRCRLALNQYYGTDYFTRDEDETEEACPTCPKALRDAKDTEVRMVRCLYPPYWCPDPYPPPPRLTNPHKITRRYGECPHPRPWESENERNDEDCRRTKVNVGRVPERSKFKPVHHKKPWDNDPEVSGESCNLWHCKLGHKRSPDDRPW